MQTRTMQLLRLALEGDPTLPADSADKVLGFLSQEDGHPQQGLLSVKEACAFLGNISRFTLHRIVSDGDIAQVRIRGRRMFNVVELRRYIAARQTRKSPSRAHRKRHSKTTGGAV